MHLCIVTRTVSPFTRIAGYAYGFMITGEVCSYTYYKFGVTKLLKNIYPNRNTTQLQHQKELL